jgi:hypothetical protein
MILYVSYFICERVAPDYEQSINYLLPCNFLISIVGQEIYIYYFVSKQPMNLSETA